MASLSPTETLVVDFEGVRAVTPSFVDECLGRLLREVGTRRFRHALRLRTDDATVRRLVNRVLVHRAQESDSARR
jgi:hypothetical protein